MKQGYTQSTEISFSGPPYAGGPLANDILVNPDVEIDIGAQHLEDAVQ